MAATGEGMSGEAGEGGGPAAVAFPLPADDPAIDERALLREMSRVSAALYGSGALLTFASLLLPFHRGTNLPAALGLVGLALVTGVAVWAVGERHPVPAWIHIGLGAAGSLFIAGLVVLVDPRWAPLYGVFLVYIPAFLFYYHPTTAATVVTVFSAGVYAAALAVARVPDWPLPWVIIVGAAVVAGSLIGGLGARARLLLQREAEALERLRELDAMKNTFLQAVSHELRTPLAVVLGMAETVHDHLHELNRKEVAHLMERQIEQAQRLQGLLVDLLDVDRLSRGTMIPRRRRVRLDRVLGQVVEVVDLKGHRLRVSLDNVEGEVDPAFLERIVENLLINAVRHTPEGTSVVLYLWGDDDRADIAVEDDGPGVDPEMREAIFEPFQRAHDFRPGVGIGLALVRALARAHEGDAWVEPRDGTGARFRVRLPLRGSETRWETRRSR